MVARTFGSGAIHVRMNCTDQFSESASGWIRYTIRRVSIHALVLIVGEVPILGECNVDCHLAREQIAFGSPSIRPLGNMFDSSGKLAAVQASTAD